MMDGFLKNIQILYYGLKDSVISWILLIGVLLILMAIFKCFTCPMKLARKKLQFVSSTCKSILEESRKRKDKTIVISLPVHRKMVKYIISTQRLALAYYYDNSDDMNAKSVLSLVSRISNSIEATRTERVREDQKALSVLLKNIDKQSEEGLKLLSQY